MRLGCLSVKPPAPHEQRIAACVAGTQFAPSRHRLQADQPLLEGKHVTLTATEDGRHKQTDHTKKHAPWCLSLDNILGKHECDCE
jgi:hypothetical protein